MLCHHLKWNSIHLSYIGVVLEISKIGISKRGQNQNFLATNKQARKYVYFIKFWIN